MKFRACILVPLK